MLEFYREVSVGKMVFL